MTPARLLALLPVYGAVGYLAADAAQDDGLTGFTGVMADVIATFGELGVFGLALAETVFPPIPSEVVLSLAGYLAQRGTLTLWLVLVAAIVGAVLGNCVLYWLGRTLGEERAKRLLAKLPLLARDDLDAASSWFARHGYPVIFFGRYIPLVRALVSLPAGAQKMPFGPFLLFTTLGIGTWNALLVTIGYLLGTQYDVIQNYLGYLDYLLYAVVAAVLIAYVVRRVRKSRS